MNWSLYLRKTKFSPSQGKLPVLVHMGWWKDTTTHHQTQGKSLTVPLHRLKIKGCCSLQSTSSSCTWVGKQLLFYYSQKCRETARLHLKPLTAEECKHIIDLNYFVTASYCPHQRRCFEFSRCKELYRWHSCASILCKGRWPNSNSFSQI